MGHVYPSMICTYDDIPNVTHTLGEVWAKNFTLMCNLFPMGRANKTIYTHTFTYIQDLDAENGRKG